MQRNEPFGERGLLFGKAGELRGIERFVEQRIGVGFAKRGQPGFGIAGANLPPVERKGAAQPFDQCRCQRPVVILELRQIGCADRKARGQLRLLEAVFGTNGP